jgi:hypothetical protein
MKKRGKKLVIIIGILVLLVAGGVSAVVLLDVDLGFLSFGSDEIPFEFIGIVEELDKCLYESGRDALWILGLNGGYEIEGINTDLGVVNYWVKDGKKVGPSKNVLEGEIENLVSSGLEFCIEDDDYLFLIEQGEPSVSVSIRTNSVKLNGRLPISTTIGEEEINFNRKYKNEIPIRLGKLYSIANKISGKLAKDPGDVDVEYLDGFEIDILLSVYDEGIVYSITDEESIVEEVPYTLRFATDVQ